ncbi:probable cytochrome P450 4d14 [Teleopsis dalmanni]|uniref:probable cytochrome P450 4d14 n=1 Tax=Teleopsis dalmanni TaxID=139649 RepID=UPI0018CEB030|nr:probable cytochrome P450 4d14 [Teleopsis dalmanni]XP_037940348.1 probable cytochrome P450 4d14 [Teleopsis dalmanni]XP_037944140.1 probable cytochrome P450 4d14 [Teleopsis dalmanni]
MFLELFLGFLTFLLIWDFIHKRRKNKFFENAGITGPKGLPLFGNVLSTINENTETIFEFIKGMRNEYGKIWRMWFFHQEGLFVQDPRFFESILSSQQVISKNKLYNLVAPWLGNGLLLSTGAKWHARRKIFTPTFHFKILEQFVEIFDQQSAVMVKTLYEKADGKTVINMFPVACLTALDIIAETAMGVRINAQMNPDFPYAKAVTEVANIVATRFIKGNQRFDIPFMITAPHIAYRLNKHIALMHNFTDTVIKDRRVALEKSIAEGSNTPLDVSDDMGVKKRMAFLDVLLQSTVDGKPLTNADIREEVDTFMFEGHDTTTSGISYTCYLIARHPEIQQKLFDEIREVIGDDKNKPITMKDLQELKYLDIVIKESLRFYPPVPIIGRITDSDVVIDGKLIPANTNIILLLYAALRDPDYFSNPDKFIPERFLNEKIDPFANVPFSAGPRNCIGQKFALLEMKSTISKLLRHFELLPLGAEVRPMQNLILRSASGINVGLRPRVYS